MTTMVASVFPHPTCRFCILYSIDDLDHLCPFGYRRCLLLFLFPFYLWLEEGIINIDKKREKKRESDNTDKEREKERRRRWRRRHRRRRRRHRPITNSISHTKTHASAHTNAHTHTLTHTHTDTHTPIQSQSQSRILFFSILEEAKRRSEWVV